MTARKAGNGKQHSAREQADELTEEELNTDENWRADVLRFRKLLGRGRGVPSGGRGYRRRGIIRERGPLRENVCVLAGGSVWGARVHTLLL